MKLYDTACGWFSAFREKPDFSPVKRRERIRRATLLRSTMDVEIRSGSGSPITIKTDPSPAL
jgi:hypothetical protein